MQPFFLCVSLTVASIVMGVPLKTTVEDVPETTTETVPEKIETIGNEVLALTPIVENLLDEPADNKTASLESQIAYLKGEIKSLQANITAIQDDITPCHLQDIHGSPITYSGKPGATSQYNAEHGPKSAFKPQAEGDKPYANVDGGLPLTVWYHFNQPQIVAKISLRSRNDGLNQAQQAPEDLIFKGSDDCKTWVNLKNVEHAGFTSDGEARAFKIPCSARRAYRCYGITSSKNHGAPAYTHGYVSFADVVMYG